MSSQHKVSLLDLVQSKRKKKDKFRLLVGRLMQETSSINSTGEHNMTPLHFAVLVGAVMLTVVVINSKANANCCAVMLMLTVVGHC